MVTTVYSVQAYSLDNPKTQSEYAKWAIQMAKTWILQLLLNWSRIFFEKILQKMSFGLIIISYWKLSRILRSISFRGRPNIFRGERGGGSGFLKKFRKFCRLLFLLDRPNWFSELYQNIQKNIEKKQDKKKNVSKLFYEKSLPKIAFLARARKRKLARKRKWNIV